MSEDDKLVPVHGGQMTTLLKHAIDKNISVDALEKLVTLHERVADRQASMAFNDALKQFQSACPAIPKTTHVSFTSKKGSKVDYRYPPLEEIRRVIQPHLDDAGLSYTWDEEVSEDGARITETCTLSHVDGHSRTARFACPTATISTAMSPQQQVANAGSFAMRQSLVRVLGLVSCDPDTDCSEASLQTITDSQVADMEALITEVGADRARFLKWAKVENLGDILAGSYAGCVRILEAKRRQ